MIIRRSASAARPETILHDIPAPIGQPKNDPLSLTYVYSDETLDWYATADDLDALEAQAKAWWIARQARLAKTRLAETDFVPDKARRTGRTINPLWDDWREKLTDIVNGSGEDIPDEPPRWTDDDSGPSGPAPQDTPDGGDRPQQLPPDPESARLSDYGEVGGASDEEVKQDAARILQNFIDGFDVADEIAGMSTARREQLTSELYREKGALRRARRSGETHDEREASIDKLVGLLARRGV